MSQVLFLEARKEDTASCKQDILNEIWRVLQVRLREPGAFQLEDTKAISFAEVAERARALQVSPSHSILNFLKGT